MRRHGRTIRGDHFSIAVLDRRRRRHVTIHRTDLSIAMLDELAPVDPAHFAIRIAISDSRTRFVMESIAGNRAVPPMRAIDRSFRIVEILANANIAIDQCVS